MLESEEDFVGFGWRGGEESVNGKFVGDFYLLLLGMVDLGRNFDVLHGRFVVGGALG